MADKLIIVESPAKANTIKKFLGGNTKVVASMGHIRDLPKSKMGVDIEHDFEPEYINIRGKGDLIKSLKKDAKSANKVYLATDPDREGEAIAWHLAHILEIPEDSVCRVTFNEITKETVQESIKKPRTIDMNLTDAQQARRVLDRIVGYKISPLLWKKVKPGLSAGRVQSVAVKIIVDRDNEIRNFIPEEYWNIYATMLDEKSKKQFEAKFYGKDGKKIELHKKDEVDEILKNIEDGKYIVTNVKEGEKKKTPAPPFTTSTMQQEASRKLGFTLKKTMSVAQGLYEGVKIPEKGTVGLITYMRTDSTRISEEARAAAKEQITKTYGAIYYENRYYKKSNDAQDAHEGIRPTYIYITPESIKDSLTADQYKLYRLVYTRFLASQMSSAIYDTINVDIDVNKYNFKASGQNLKFKGFMTLYVEGKDNEQEDEESTTIPKLKNGQEVIKKKLDSKQSFTEPPARYTEFDRVAEGKEEWKQVLREFYPQFEQEVEKVDKELEHVKLEEEVSDVKCDKCGRNMVVKMSRYGKFLACPGYPECKNVKPFVVTIDEPCPVCGAKVQVRKTKRGKNYYICENNPASCNYISWNKPKIGEKWTPDENIKTEEKKTTRKRKTSTTKRKKPTDKKKK